MPRKPARKLNDKTKKIADEEEHLKNCLNTRQSLFGNRISVGSKVCLTAFACRESDRLNLI